MSEPPRPVTCSSTTISSSSMSSTDSLTEKKSWGLERQEHILSERSQAEEYGISEVELEKTKIIAEGYTVEELRQKVTSILEIHKHDPNFPQTSLDQFEKFLNSVDPETSDKALLSAVGLEAALILTNSPYASVRAVISPTDDALAPCSTVRAWFLGLVFGALMGVINQLFSIRQPAIHVGAHVAQLLAYPAGRALAAWLPDWGFTIFGVRHSLNPGAFSRKEHMLVTIMASVSGTAPYTTYIVWTQFLPRFFGQSYAGSFAYQMLIGLGTNFVGYGLAGLARSFLVYPAYCVWPQSLVTIALNGAFHDERMERVKAPWGRWMTMSRIKFFFITGAISFVWFWFPNFLVQALSIFSWISWIDPGNTVLNSIVGFNNGLGLNPLPTFDWNNIMHSGTDPLMLPVFATVNRFAGQFLSAFLVLGLWYSNTYNTAYLPMNSNRMYDNRGRLYNVSRAVDEQGLFDPDRYEAYSQPHLAAGNITVYVCYFALYTATFTYAVLYHRHEICRGFVELWKNLTGRGGRMEERYGDVHNRLMAAYKEVPGWWFAVVLVLAVLAGGAGMIFWPTGSSPLVILFGILLCLLFLVPIGVVKAMTGVEVHLAVLAEFLGGAVFPGNALAVNFVKAYGFVTCAHAIGFAHDLKLAHYVKIPPRTTFAVQMAATLLATFVSTAVLNYQMRFIPGVCTPSAPFRFTCPQITAFMSSSVLWGTVGPRKVFGSGGLYGMTLLGFPFGFALALAVWWARKRFNGRSGWGWLRQVHPVVMLAGAIHWAPYNLSYIWPAVPVAWLSWCWVKTRYLPFWSKYNFVLSASLSSGIAIAGLVIFVVLQAPGVKLNWIGNSIVYKGCEAPTAPCRLKHLAKGEYFGPRIGEFS